MEPSQNELNRSSDDVNEKLRRLYYELKVKNERLSSENYKLIRENAEFKNRFNQMKLFASEIEKKASIIRKSFNDILPSQEISINLVSPSKSPLVPPVFSPNNKAVVKSATAPVIEANKISAFKIPLTPMSPLQPMQFSPRTIGPGNKIIGNGFKHPEQLQSPRTGDATIKPTSIMKVSKVSTTLSPVKAQLQLKVAEPMDSESARVPQKSVKQILANVKRALEGAPLQHIDLTPKQVLNIKQKEDISVKLVTLCDSPSNMPDSPNTVTPIVTKPKSEGKVADATTKNDADPLKGDPKDNVLRKTKHSHFNPVIKLNKVDDSSNELVPIRWTENQSGKATQIKVEPTFVSPSAMKGKRKNVSSTVTSSDSPKQMRVTRSTAKIDKGGSLTPTKTRKISIDGKQSKPGDSKMVPFKDGSNIAVKREANDKADHRTKPRAIAARRMSTRRQTLL